MCYIMTYFPGVYHSLCSAGTGEAQRPATLEELFEKFQLIYAEKVNACDDVSTAWWCVDTLHLSSHAVIKSSLFLSLLFTYIQFVCVYAILEPYVELLAL